jgi:hypothetical protein
MAIVKVRHLVLFAAKALTSAQLFFSGVNSFSNICRHVVLAKCFSDFRQSRTTLQVLGAHADHFRKIPHTQMCMQMNWKKTL